MKDLHELGPKAQETPPEADGDLDAGRPSTSSGCFGAIAGFALGALAVVGEVAAIVWLEDRARVLEKKHAGIEMLLAIGATLVFALAKRFWAFAVGVVVTVALFFVLL